MKLLLKIIRDASVSIVQLVLPVTFYLYGVWGDFYDVTVTFGIVFSSLYSAISLGKHLRAWHKARGTGVRDTVDRSAEQFERAAAVLLNFPFFYLLLHTHWVAMTDYFVEALKVYYYSWYVATPLALIFPWLALAFLPRYKWQRIAGYIGLALCAPVVAFIVWMAFTYAK